MTLMASSVGTPGFHRRRELQRRESSSLGRLEIARWPQLRFLSLLLVPSVHIFLFSGFSLPTEMTINLCLS